VAVAVAVAVPRGSTIETVEVAVERTAQKPLARSVRVGKENATAVEVNRASKALARSRSSSENRRFS